MLYNLPDTKEVRQVQHDGGAVDQVPGNAVGDGEHPPQEVVWSDVQAPDNDGGAGPVVDQQGEAAVGGCDIPGPV